MSLAASGATHQGGRSTNEDSWLVDLPLGLLLVADGMGGHNAGEVASALAVSVVRQSLQESQAGPGQTRLVEALQRANDQILSAAAADPDRAGMGTTVVAVLVSGTRAIYASVGDSRIYLWQGGRLTQLTRDDSWLFSTLGEAAANEAHALGTHPMRHVLTKVVGLRAELEPAVSECVLDEGDCLLLCSDGVHGSLPQEALAEVLAAGGSVADLARDVVDLAIARGASDNATAIIARVE